jgi:glycosyltransferase involved in cell wall biosynthesis
MVPTVSIIVPNYNHARFLDERLTSILNQTYKDFELIFLDDASSDNSVDVFRKYSTYGNVRAILNDRNSGSTFRQWNRGVRAAAGCYIWIAESDDVAEPQFLATLVPILERNSQVGIAYCNSIIIDEYGEKKYTVDRWSEKVSATRWWHDYINSGTEECRRYLVCRNTIPNASAVVFRKSIYERCGYANETMTRCGDWWVWAQMLLLSDIAYVAAPLNLFRRHTSLSYEVNKHNVALEETLHILHEIVSRLDLSPEVESKMTRTFIDHLRWRQEVSNNEAVVLPSTLLYQAALLSEQLYSAILEFVYDHSNWSIDWLFATSSSFDKYDMLKRGSNNIFRNLSAITGKQQHKLMELKSERDRLLSSRCYRFARQLQKARGRLAPNDSVQYNCLLKAGRLIKRICKGRKLAC